LKPRWTKQLLSALIINLKIGGVFVRDTDLLQKDISALLNSDITPAFNLVMQLARLLPIFSMKSMLRANCGSLNPHG